MKTGWISIKERLPEYETDVLVCRPNQYSGNDDILIAFLREKKEEGRRYGGNGLTTFNDYWVLPAVALFETITHWQPIPNSPNSENLQSHNDLPKNRYNDAKNWLSEQPISKQHLGSKYAQRQYDTALKIAAGLQITDK